MEKLLKDRRAIRSGIGMALLFPLIYFTMSLLGWGNNVFSWWEALLVGLLNGALFWFFMASFRQFRDEDVTPR
ncbi:MAG: hypothetical protein ACTIID_16065 [Brevibacterium linens]|uniref:hypothetical protein n=1 Tax=Brevibacterium linens TaxID=1703 RepID=UPI000FCA37AF|nr:hypothetical protein [Brevibacterium linens]AZU02157.1 hypothetical protein CXR29_16920 [Brevibacterium linens]